MDKQTKQQEILQRLHNLADQPSTQARYALELLDQERGNQVVSAALDIVTAAARRDRPFASLRVTWCDGSNCQVLCFTIGPCLRSEMFKLDNDFRL
jgi:hypothetical protein